MLYYIAPIIHTDRRAGAGTQVLHQAACFDKRTRAWFWSGALTCQNVNAISLAICAPECYLRAILGPVVDAFYSWVPSHNLVVVIPSMMRDLSRDKWRLGVKCLHELLLTG